MAQINQERVVYYTTQDNQKDSYNGHSTTNDISKAYAKEICHNNNIKYYILIKNNYIFNPFDIYARNKNGLSKNKDLFYKTDVRFKIVNKNVFDMYLEFLRSQNLSLLYNIQRKAMI